MTTTLRSTFRLISQLQSRARTYPRFTVTNVDQSRIFSTTPIATMPSGHATAKVGNTVIAETDNWETADGNVYFPHESLKKEYFSGTETHTTCPWKGLASYYTINVDGNSMKDSAWYYPQAKEKAKHFENYVAFYKNKVNIEAKE